MQPLVFEPIFKRIRWGGRRLGTVLGKPIGPETDYAESWEVSDHGDDQSIVADGPYAGQTMSQLVQSQNLPLFGHAAGRQQFPLLVKYLDANDALSLQVHPNDQLAKEVGPHENGKTEAWVIIDAAPGSLLYVGFHEGVSEAKVLAAIDKGRLESLLHTIEVQPGDCVFVPAGTIHAVGQGILLAEVQQSSDITYRLYDWNRPGPDGKLRELQIGQALRCLNFDRGPVDPVVPRLLAADHALEELVDAEYFVLHRHRSDAAFPIPSDNNCHVLMVLAGSATLKPSGRERDLPFGQTIVLPAERDEITITPAGDVTLLDAFVPAAAR